MACGVLGDNLIVRVGKEKYLECLQASSVKPFDQTGKPMTGWIEVLPEITKDDQSLAAWVHTGLEYTKSLPNKNS